MKAAIICIGHGTATDGTIFEADKNQVQKALEVAKEKNIQDIILVGGNGYRGHLEADLMAAEVPKDSELNVFVETESKNTVQNALFSKEIVQEHGYDTLYLVCWTKHIPRAPFTFKKIFRDQTVITVPTKGKLGGNSYKRLNSPFSLFFWEIPAWLYTFYYLIFKGSLNEKKS